MRFAADGVAWSCWPVDLRIARAGGAPTSLEVVAAADAGDARPGKSWLRPDGRLARR